MLFALEGKPCLKSSNVTRKTIRVMKHRPIGDRYCSKTQFCFISFFLSGFPFTGTDNLQDSRGREGTRFYSTLPLPPTLEDSDIYLRLCTWGDYHIFLIATLVFTRLLFDEIYHLIESLFDWLIMWCWFSFVCLLI